MTVAELIEALKEFEPDQLLPSARMRMAICLRWMM